MQSDQIVHGRVLKVYGKFICWDSFKAKWFLGPMRLSEIFQPTFVLEPRRNRSSRELELWKAFPTAEDYYLSKEI